MLPAARVVLVRAAISHRRTTKQIGPLQAPPAGLKGVGPACSTSNEGAPSSRSLRGWDAMLPAARVVLVRAAISHRRTTKQIGPLQAPPAGLKLQPHHSLNPPTAHPPAAP